jgi:hypothetical protein
MIFKTVSIVLGSLLLQCGMGAQTQPQPPTQQAAQTAPKPVASYGSNPAAGKTFTHDGVELYYEVYGAGEPLLLVHGIGGLVAAIAGLALVPAVHGDTRS